MPENKMMIAYCITKRKGRAYWNRIGTAFVNHDGSINVRLESVPVSGELQLREYVSHEEHEEPEER